MIARILAWLRQFTILREHPRLAIAVAIVILAIIISPIPPIP